MFNCSCQRSKVHRAIVVWIIYLPQVLDARDDELEWKGHVYEPNAVPDKASKCIT